MEKVCELNEEELSHVTGGNYGDKVKYNSKDSVVFNYSEGQTVLVYKGMLHIQSNTRPAVIKTKYAQYSGGKYYAAYIVKFGEGELTDISEEEIYH